MERAERRESIGPKDQFRRLLILFSVVTLHAMIFILLSQRPDHNIKPPPAPISVKLVVAQPATTPEPTAPEPKMPESTPQSVQNAPKPPAPKEEALPDELSPPAINMKLLSRASFSSRYRIQQQIHHPLSP